MIKFGSRGEDVKKIQENLGLKADGIFGEITRKAVIEFQQKRGLLADGIVGPKTWNALFETSTTTEVDTTLIVSMALMLVENYQKRRVKYSQPKRQFGIDANFADCSSAVSTILKMAGANEKLKSTNTRAMRDEISAKGGSFRKNNPLPGDIMMWGGHVTIVTSVDAENVYFAHMGNSGARIGKAKLTNGDLKTESTWGNGGFIGFWTIS